MDIDRSRRLSLDLAVAHLDEPEVLTALLAAHVVAPARALFGGRFPRPRRDEDGNLLERLPIELSDGRTILEPDDVEPDASTTGFDSFIRGWVLFRRLFPQGADGFDELIAEPERAYFGEARFAARVLWSDLARRVERLFEGQVRGRAPREDEGLEELRRMQDLLRRALTPPGKAWWYTRGDFGLRVVDRDAALELDAILRTQAHQRLVWFGGGTWSLSVQRDGVWQEMVYDRGVFGTVIPETIAAVVALDFTETLNREPTIGSCAMCDMWVELTPQQISRQRAGQPIYHHECHEQHRRKYVRDYQRGRRGRSKSRAATPEGQSDGGEPKTHDATGNGKSHDQ